MVQYSSQDPQVPSYYILIVSPGSAYLGHLKEDTPYCQFWLVGWGHRDKLAWLLVKDPAIPQDLLTLGSTFTHSGTDTL